MDAETLKNGSAFHKVRRFPNGFMITVAEDTPDCRAKFQEIVKRSRIELRAQGYAVELQPSMNFSGCDMAIITWIANSAMPPRFPPLQPAPSLKARGRP